MPQTESSHAKHHSSMEIMERLLLYGNEIITSSNMQQSMQFLHHGQVTVFGHSIGVAYVSLLLASKLNMRVDEQTLVRGALLHDYFLYDWHVRENWHKFHGFRHPGFALQNALADFRLNQIEADIIRKHMFPLTLFPPKYKESLLVCIADKLCAIYEFFYSDYIATQLRYKLVGWQTR